jgi:hypothetical protein
LKAININPKISGEAIPLQKLVERLGHTHFFFAISDIDLGV